MTEGEASRRHRAMSILRHLARTGSPGSIDGVVCKCQRTMVLGIVRVELSADCPHHGAATTLWREVAVPDEVRVGLTRALQCGTDKG